MLRLCHGLDRFSVDLDFWMVETDRIEDKLKALKTFLSQFYFLKDAANKFYTMIFEIGSPTYSRSLKIEIRKHQRTTPRTEQTIAYTPHSGRQVLLRSITLEDMMHLKTAAFLDRREIRDVFDMEFLVRRGIRPVGEAETLNEILAGIEAFSRLDYGTKLGSLLVLEKRRYYRTNNFTILKGAIQDELDYRL